MHTWAANNANVVISGTGSPWTFTYIAAAAARLQLVTTPASGGFVGARFMARFSDPFYAVQGGATVVAATTDMQYDDGVYWGIDVSSPAEAYLSIIPTSTASRTLRISRIDSVAALGSF